MAKKLHLISLGCTKNLVDSEVMLGKLRNYELSDDASKSDVIIINTCGFIDAAKEESIQAILQTHEQRKKNSVLVVAGCLSERYKEQLQSELPEVDIFTGVGDYGRIDELITKKQSSFSPEVYLANEKAPRIITGSNYHAYIKIAEGCNQQCSFCAIPKFKGKLQSRTIGSIVDEVKALVERGYWDFSFVSQDSSSYGRDLGYQEGLIDLIEAIEKIEGVKSARILYLYPSTTSFALIDVIAESQTFHTYYDMPIQHIDEGVLKSMKRGFGSAQTIALLEHMRSKKDSFLRTGIIAGYPAEDEVAFERLEQFLQNFRFDRISVFSYSHEESTSAFALTPHEYEVVERRTQRLAVIAQEAVERSLAKMVGTTQRVVIDGPSSEHDFLLSARILGWTPEIDGEILINNTNDLDVGVGSRYQVKITELVGSHLLATLGEYEND